MQAILGVILLMLNVFIDGTHLANDGGAKAVPVYLSLGNTDSSSARCDLRMYCVVCLTDYFSGFERPV